MPDCSSFYFVCRIALLGYGLIITAGITRYVMKLVDVVSPKKPGSKEPRGKGRLTIQKGVAVTFNFLGTG